MSQSTSSGCQLFTAMRQYGVRPLVNLRGHCNEQLSPQQAFEPQPTSSFRDCLKLHMRKKHCNLADLKGTLQMSSVRTGDRKGATQKA